MALFWTYPQFWVIGGAATLFAAYMILRAAAAPVIQTFGLVKIGDLDPSGVRVVGFPMEKIAKVNSFQQSLYRQGYGKYETPRPIDDPKLTKEEKAEQEEDARLVHEIAKE